MPPTPKLVGERGIYQHGQNIGLLSHHQVGEDRVRVTLDLDMSYHYQSRTLIAEVWRPAMSDWSEVASMLWSEVEMPKQYGPDAKLQQEALIAIEEKILERSLWVLFAKGRPPLGKEG